MSDQRLAAAKDRILELLKQAGPRGETTWSLINATHHSAAARRVWDLTEEGWHIEKRNEGRGVFRWILKGRQPAPSLLALMEDPVQTPIDNYKSHTVI